MKTAKVVHKQGQMTPNGREAIAQIRMGAKGTGKEVGRVIYWPWSSPSCDQADRIISEIVEREGVELVNG